MRTPSIHSRSRAGALAIVAALALSLSFASLASAKTQLNPFAQLGGEVDLTTAGEYCLENTADTCLESTEAAAAGASPGRFGNPQSVAVDQSTHNIYVSEGLGQRVQKFAANGEFLTMFGMSVLTAGASGEGALTENENVITSVLTTSRVFAAGQTITGTGIQPGTRIVSVGSETITLSKPASASGTGVLLEVQPAAGGVPVNERQTLTLTGGPTEGTFSLTYQTPNPSSSEATAAEIPFNATAAEVKAALEGLSNMAAVGGEVAVTGAAGGPYAIEFKGARYEDTNVEQLNAESSLGGGSSPEAVVKTVMQGDGAPADDVCTKAQQVDCEVGFAGGVSFAKPRATELARQFNGPDGVAVDNACYEANLTEVTVPKCAATYPANGNIFVEDRFNNRVQEFTPSGEFVAMIGGEVNKTAVEKGGSESEKNLCTEAEIESVAKVECGRGIENPAAGSTPKGQFRSWPAGLGNLQFVGLNTKKSPAEDVLYVGDEGRVQEFEASTGHWRRDLTLPSGEKVHALTAANNGDLYVAGPGIEGVHVYEPESDGSTELTSFEPGSNLLTTTSVKALARDPFGHIAVVEGNEGGLYSSTGKFLGSYGVGFTEGGIAFDVASEDLYAPKASLRKVTTFFPAITPEALTGLASPVGTETATLAGEIEPDGFNASSRFEYGVCPTHYPSTAACPGSAYGSAVASTPESELAGESKVAVQSSLTGLLPNQTYHYRLAAENKFGPSDGEEAVFATEPLPVAIAAAPQASFVTASTAVLGGQLNPENAIAEYWFEYTSSGSWAGATKTSVTTTPIYTATLVSSAEEAVGLEPGTTYHARLVAKNEHAETTDGPEATFVTAPTPVPSASTGGYSPPTPTGTVISASVNPDGVPATYAFELGVYAGAGTQYGVVFSGPAGSGSTATEHTLALTGLQPGTTYAYRVSITSGYIPGSHTQQGAAVLFTTAGLPVALVPPPLVAQLPIPAVKFPAAQKHPPKKKKAKKKKRKKKVTHGAKRKRGKKGKKGKKG